MLRTQLSFFFFQLCLSPLVIWQEDSAYAFVVSSNDLTNPHLPCQLITVEFDISIPMRSQNQSLRRGNDFGFLIHVRITESILGSTVTRLAYVSTHEGCGHSSVDDTALSYHV